MSNEKLLEAIKDHLSITIDDDDLDRTLTLKMNAVKNFLEDGGANLNENFNDKAINCIAIGVNDLLNNKAGDTKFSPAFDMLARQVCRG